MFATGEIALLRPAGVAPLLERIRRVRAVSGIPLVGDDRWSSEHWGHVARAAADARLTPDIAWASMTSGSSGSPKIVLRTAMSWSASFPLIARLLDAGEADVVAVPAPPVSSLTLFSIAHALEGGPRPALARGHAIVPADYADATCFHGTPHAFRALLERGCPPKLRAALVGGSHLDADLRERAQARGIRVTSYYGSAELSIVATDDGSGLRVIDGIETRIVEGELQVRSPFAAERYASAPLRGDGRWVTSGDLATIDDGLLRLRGRADGAILTASATVIPEEVEAALRELPGVRDAVVCGLPDAVLGAVVVAIVEPESGAEPSVGDLRSQAARSLAPSHRPRRWHLATLPRTAAGKPARAETYARLIADGGAAS